jgi:hypothetical protein
VALQLKKIKDVQGCFALNANINSVGFACKIGMFMDIIIHAGQEI